MTLLEICLDDIPGAALAERGGADRIELCANLAQGGTTPSIGTVSTVLESVRDLGVQLLVRQRPGDFVYCAAEVAAMTRDIEAIRSLAHPLGVTIGFVVGALTAEGTIDVPVMTALLRECRDAPVTFHRAFDDVTDQGAALEILIDLGIGRVLTSGGKTTAMAGLAQLAELVDQAEDRISVLAGGSIRGDNVAEIVRNTGVREVHLRAGKAGSTATATSATVIREVAVALAGVGSA